MKKIKIITALSALLLAFNINAKDITLHTNFGDIKVEVDEKNAPISSQNFINYAQSGFYNNLIFHRVMDGFMIQGGGFNEKMEQKKANATIKNEANNGLKNDRGTIAMARTSDPHSASSQFFINLKDNDFLNFSSETQQGWGYAVFGKVSAGMDVVDKIAKVKTGKSGRHSNVPVEAVIIKSVTVE